MARKDLTVMSVYLTDAERQVLVEAAALERRSFSNFLVTAGLARAAKQHGLEPEDDRKDGDS